MFRIVVGAVALLAVALLAACAGPSGEISTPSPSSETPITTPAGETPTPAAAEGIVYRWVDVTVTVPEGSGLRVIRDFYPLSRRVERPAITVQRRGRSQSKVVIDGETGKILRDSVEPVDRAAIDEVLHTVTVLPLDRLAAPWPYNGEHPDVPRDRDGNITFITPDTASGVRVSLGLVMDGESLPFLDVGNGLSRLVINSKTGAVIQERTSILPEDEEAFDRFLDAVEYVGP